MLMPDFLLIQPMATGSSLPMAGPGFLIIHGAGPLFITVDGFMNLITDGCGFPTTNGDQVGYPGEGQMTITDGLLSARV